MKIIKPYAKIVGSGADRCFDKQDGIDVLKFCEEAARISHRSEDDITENSWQVFMERVVMRRGDFSVIEHRVITVEAVVDRGITHEIVRHRIGAYTQESTRFVNYEKKMPPTFIYPFTTDEVRPEWYNAIEEIEKSYKTLLSYGVAPQIARSVFPNALSSKIWITYNLRNWRHFFLMRTSKEAHPQMRQVMIPLLKEFQEKIPIIYDDIIPESSQMENMKKMR